MTNSFPYPAEAFSGGQITLVWSLPATPSDQPKKHHLMWCAVECFAAEVPLPETEPWAEDKTLRLAGDPSERLFLSRVTVPFAEALAWYGRLAQVGRWSRPHPETGELPEPTDGEVPLGHRFVEPPWPGAMLSPSDNRFGAVPLGLKDPLVSSVLPDTCHVASWRPERRAKAAAWIRAKTGVDLGQDTRLWGTAHLIVHNPGVRRCYVTLGASEPGAPDGVNVRTVLREGGSYSDLLLTVLERRDEAWRLLYQGPVTGPDMAVRTDAEPDQVATMLTRGTDLVHLSKPHSFLKQILMSAIAVTGQRQVTVERDEGEETFTVPTHGAPTVTRVGEETTEDAPQVLRGIRQRIRGATAADRDDQVWLQAEREEAKARLRKLLGRAHERLLFVDPYFGSGEIADFVTAIPCTAVAIQILGSTDGLTANVVNKERRTKVEALRRLKAMRDQVVQGAGVPDVEIRLMRGKKPPIHDRFLVADSEIFLLGSSLNEFGTRGTMLVRLPHPELVLPALDDAWDTSPTLEVRLAEAAHAATTRS